ncbi:hypothetical protein PR048_032615 [Dryococelus australis]|uniref:DDE Tnp4 domain-containing protein n=1 Tax=Dryococelus australis TaxID=614101 RepID=A0ABQ9G2Q1_9NEOP|nr:hypothetical protein PR048_032615 [Dryococelus australis]
MVFLCRFLATGNSITLLHYEYLLGTLTIASIVRTTCQFVWDTLLHTYTALKTDNWKVIAVDVYNCTNFPNCVGAVGKAVRVVSPKHSGSLYNHHESLYSIVLLALINTDYCFTAIDLGAYLPNDRYGRAMPYVIVEDEAFVMSSKVLRPYLNRGVSINKHIFNYRLSRVRRMVECTFDIIVNK